MYMYTCFNAMSIPAHAHTVPSGCAGGRPGGESGVPLPSLALYGLR